MTTGGTLAIVIPTAALLAVAFYYMVSTLAGRLDDQSTKISDLSTQLSASVDRAVEQLGQRIDDLGKRVDGQITTTQQLSESVTTVREELGHIRGRVDTLETH